MSIIDGTDLVHYGPPIDSAVGQLLYHVLVFDVQLLVRMSELADFLLHGFIQVLCMLAPLSSIHSTSAFDSIDLFIAVLR